MGYAAVILAGGAGRRLGGLAKPALTVGGTRMVDRVLAAVADAGPRVVVAPGDLPLPAGVLRTC
ncbi:MAG: NTP transferase domain-containing protein, partial [Micromonosporaceae bacterium]|nr:NTP transferase domain-containing protein [Micromonosporaceae bacterium]